MSGFYGLEATMHNGAMGIVGDPIFAGILVLAFFLGFVMLQQTRLDGKMAVVPGAIILAAAVLPPVVIILFTGGFGIILAWALWKVSRQ